MLKLMRYAGWLAALVFVLALGVATACWTMPRWLPVLLRPYLPVGVSLVMQASPGWRQGGFWLPDVQLRLAQCQPATLSGLLVRYREGRWQLEAESLTLDAACLRQWPVSSNMTTPLLAQWQQRLPQAELMLHRIAITPWLTQVAACNSLPTRRVSNSEFRAISYRCRRNCTAPR